MNAIIEASGQFVKPIESFTLPTKLDGHDGELRSHGICQINASTDIEAISCWLETFDNQSTLRAFRKEVERLLLWSALVKQKAVSSLKHQDLKEFGIFLSAPPTSWISPRRKRTSPEWRPFMGPLSSGSVQTAMTIINNLFSWLVDAGYLMANPLALQRNRRRNTSDMPTQQLTNSISHKEIQQVLGVERVLSEEEWDYLLDAIGNMPQGSPKKRFVRARLLFIFQFGVLCAPRVSEMAAARMCDFRQIKGRWWWLVLGKGSKFAKVPVNQQMLYALSDWREELGLSPLPTPDEDTPLLRSIGRTTGLTDNSLYKLITEAASAIAVNAPPSIANTLSSMSPHWLRHTGITRAADSGMDKRFLKMSARHEKMETTEIYTHTDDELWHQAWENAGL